jgi:hypothetical protein
MPNPDCAIDLLNKNDKAIVVVTDGREFKYDSKGTGYSGNWRAKRPGLTKIIVYKKCPEGGEVFVGEFVKYDAPTDNDNRRKLIRFANLTRKGVTHKNFWEFTDSQSHSILYLPRS